MWRLLAALDHCFRGGQRGVLHNVDVPTARPIRRGNRRLAQHGIDHSERIRRITLVIVLHLIRPLVLLYLTINEIDWRVVLTLYQPDLGYWLYTVGIIVFLKGLLEIALICRLPGGRGYLATD